MIRRRAIVRGRVQGVFYRASTRDAALAAGVAGWVRNRPDGTVEAALEGDPAAVEAVLAFLRSGPPHARVDAVDVAEEPPEALAGFEIR